jgi:hypothetical protein
MSKFRNYSIKESRKKNLFYSARIPGIQFSAQSYGNGVAVGVGGMGVNVGAWVGEGVTGVMVGVGAWVFSGVLVGVK